ncbi:MAG TPA: cytochrome c oxidase subunit II [Anaerolineales bacterium]
MTVIPPAKPRRVLIASSHPLFGQGLRRLLQERQGAGVVVVGMVSSLEEALAALEKLDPDLVIVDYDDVVLNRDEFLARFVEGEKKLRVVLLSLQSAQDAVVYDRRTLAASQIDNWLEEWTYAFDAQVSPEFEKGAINTVDNKRSHLKHYVIAGLLVIIVTALLIFGLDRVRLLPVQASAQAVPIDNLFSLEFKIIAFLFSLIVVFMVYSIVVFRRKRGDLTDAAHIEGNRRLEVLWTIAPLITVLYLAYLGSQSLAETVRAAPHPLEVKVVAAQWSWRFEYPDSGVVSDKLVLPVNQQTLLHLTSMDVIHNFWVPEFRVKQDILPGGPQFVRDLRITPTIIGDYKVSCAQMCGLRHAYMVGAVQVVSQADFDAWIASQSATSNDPVARGQKWAKQYGCLACHSIDGTKLVGPSWKGLAGSSVTLTDGTTVTADDAYLIESIRQPGAKIVQGFADIMPHNVAASLTDAQLQDLVAFIKSLK